MSKKNYFCWKVSQFSATLGRGIFILIFLFKGNLIKSRWLRRLMLVCRRLRLLPGISLAYIMQLLFQENTRHNRVHDVSRKKKIALKFAENLTNDTHTRARMRTYLSTLKSINVAIIRTWTHLGLLLYVIVCACPLDMSVAKWLTARKMKPASSVRI